MYKDKFLYGWVIIGAGLLIAVIGMAARHSFGIFLKSIETDSGMSWGAAASIFSVYILICRFMSVLSAGHWTDTARGSSAFS